MEGLVHPGGAGFPDFSPDGGAWKNDGLIAEPEMPNAVDAYPVASSGATPARDAAEVAARSGCTMKLGLGRAAAASLLAALAGCGSLDYYWQSASGHLQLMRAARPVPEWVAEPHTAPALRERLQLAQRIRAFAVSELHLPDNASYHRYADLQRRAAVWNVVAAPPYSLTLKTWCFPVAGCVSYRGYFSEAAAQAEAAALADQGLEVGVHGVPAYSTLGWLNWAGGDPLLNTFIAHTEGELARLVFHELAHQVVYASGDTAFNESFATAVERLGGARWLAQHASPAARTEYARFDARRQAFRALTRETRATLAALYPEPPRDDLSSAERAALDQGKAQAMADFRARYAALKAGWGGYAGYDAWVAQANNATLGAQAAYDDLVPAFEALFEQQDRDWRRFYDAVKQLAALDREARRAALQQALWATPAPR